MLKRSGACLLLVLCVNSASKCNLPSSIWCSTNDIAEVCQVQQQCNPWLGEGSKSVPTPVNVGLYYESLCPGCKEFISTQLQTAWMKLGNSGILNITLVPYGNAHEQQVGEEWQFECQHGVRECAGNIMETCVLYLVPFKMAAPVIFCMEAADDPAYAAKECLNKQGIDFHPVFQCANGSLGNSLEHKMALMTESLNPPHMYTPWITLNEMHTEDIQQQASEDLVKLVCETYTGPKPDACNDIYTSKYQLCYKK